METLEQRVIHRAARTTGRGRYPLASKELGIPIRTLQDWYLNGAKTAPAKKLLQVLDALEDKHFFKVLEVTKPLAPTEV